MSSDNYYTVLKDSSDGLWYLHHGFASDDEPSPRKASPGFSTRAEAIGFYLDQDHSFLSGNYYSEYGLVP